MLGKQKPPQYTHLPRGGRYNGANGIMGYITKDDAELCNGSTYDSDSYCLGSNPSSAAKEKAPNFGAFCYATGYVG